MAFEPMMWTEDFIAEYQPQVDVLLGDNSLQDVEFSSLLALVDDERSLSLGTYFSTYNPGEPTDFTVLRALPPPPPSTIREPMPPTPTPPPPPTTVVVLPPPTSKPVGECLTRGGHISQLQVTARALLGVLGLVLNDEQKGLLAPYIDPVDWNEGRIKEATSEANRKYHVNRINK